MESCVPCELCNSDHLPADVDGGDAEVSCIPCSFFFETGEKSKIPSAYKFPTITQWISNLPGSTVDNVLQRKSNRL